MLVPVLNIHFEAHFHVSLLRQNSNTENVRSICNIFLIKYTENTYHAISRVSYRCTKFIESGIISTASKWQFSLHLNSFRNPETFPLHFLHAFWCFTQKPECLQLRKGHSKYNIRCARKFCLLHFPILAPASFPVWSQGT